MSDDRWTIVDRLLDAALEREPHERAAFLDDACADDEALRREVDSLLAHDSRAAGFLSRPAAALMGDGTSVMGRQLGPYAIHARLGAGGMGEVYRARDTKLGRDVAIKILPRLFTTDPERRARFDREARLLASLNHPHIGAIYGVEEMDGTPRPHPRARRRRHARRADRQGACLDQRGADHRAADRRRARSGARERHHSPRSETGQHQDHARRRGQGARLRPGEGGERRCLRAGSDTVTDRHDRRHARRRDSRDGGLHEPRAGAREAGRQAHGSSGPSAACSTRC